MSKVRSTAQVRELHVALVGMAGSGKSALLRYDPLWEKIVDTKALTVKYITKRFIAEYDPTLEDTYCKQDTVDQQPVMVWLMDTVDDPTRDSMRWIAWADVYLVVYDVTSQLSLQQVSEADGTRSAQKYGAIFAEANAVGDPRPLSQLLHETFSSLLSTTRSPSPRLCSSDSEITSSRKSGFSVSFRSNSRSHLRSKTKTPPTPLHKSPSIGKLKTGSKLLKLFHNNS